MIYFIILLVFILWIYMYISMYIYIDRILYLFIYDLNCLKINMFIFNICIFGIYYVVYMFYIIGIFFFIRGMFIWSRNFEELDKVSGLYSVLCCFINIRGRFRDRIRVY